MIQEFAANMMRRFCVGDIFRRVALNKPDKTAIIPEWRKWWLWVFPIQGGWKR